MSNENNKIKLENEPELLNKKRVSSPFDMLREGSRKQALAECQGKKANKKRTDKEEFEEISKLVKERKLNSKIAEVRSGPAISISNLNKKSFEMGNSNFNLQDYCSVIDNQDDCILSDDLKPVKTIKSKVQSNTEQTKTKQLTEIMKNKKLSDQRKLNNFSSAYNNFLSKSEFVKVTYDISKQFVEANENKLFNLYSFIHKENGIYDVILYSKLDHYLKTNLDFQNKDEAKQFIDKYLFHFLTFESNSIRPSYIGNEWLDFDPKYMRQVKIIEYDPSLDINNQIKVGLDEDICILRGFLDPIKLGYKTAKESFYDNIFTKEFLETKSIKIDVREQKSEFNLFENNHHTASLMDIKKYVEYIDNFECTLKKNQGISPPTVKYGVNLESSYIPEIYNTLKQKVPSILRFTSELDSLFYVRQPISGVTSPQLYLKVKDAWTGGHEENMRLRSININHGPGSSIWFGVGEKDADFFHSTVSKNYNGFDIYSKEGIWFAPIEFFMKHKIDCNFFIQEPGDIVLVGPGCIHWVKALNHSVHSSWNFFPKEYRLFKTATQRYKHNKEIKFRNILPLFTLMLDLLNHELDTLDWSLVDFCYYELRQMIEITNLDFLTFQNSFLGRSDYNHVPIFKEPDNELVIFCSDCQEEIFNYWGMCKKCVKKSTRKLCMDCFKKHLKENKACNKAQNLFLFYKYNQSSLTKFLERCKSKLENLNETKDEIQQELIKKSYAKEKQYSSLFNVRASSIKIVDSFCENISIQDQKLILKFVSQSEALSLEQFEKYFESITKLEDTDYTQLDPLFSNFKFSPDHKPVNYDNLGAMSPIRNANYYEEEANNLNFSQFSQHQQHSNLFDNTNQTGYNSREKLAQMLTINNSKLLDEEEMNINYSLDINIGLEQIEVAKPKISLQEQKEASAKRDLKNAKKLLADLSDPFKVYHLKSLNSELDQNIKDGLSLIENNLSMVKLIQEARISEFLKRICYNQKLPQEIVKVVQEVYSKIEIG